MTGDSAPRPAPHLRVVRGDLDPEEIAALVAALLAVARPGDTPDRHAPAPQSAWRDRSRLLRRPLRSGPDAWRSSFRPG